MKKPIHWPVLILLIALLMQGCALAPRGPETQTAVEQALTTPEPATPSEPAAPELPPSLEQSLLAPSPMVQPEIRFDVSAQEVKANDFFMGLVEGTPYNMVVHPEVSGTISMTLKNVTVSEVMELARSVYGYNYRQTQVGFQVLASGLQSRIYHVNYLNLMRRGLSQTRISSGQVSQTDTDDDDENEDNDSQTEVVSGSQVDTETLSDFWTELRTALALIVGQKDGRRVIVQPQASLVVVHAMPHELDDVGDYLQAVQGNLQRQVILETKIVEVELNDGFQTGINWAALAEPGDGKSVVVGQTGGGTFFSEGSSSIAGNTGTLNPLATALVEGTDTAAFGGIFSAAVDLGDFTAFIELLKSQGNVQVLSSPRISTVNNQKAVIKVGSDEFFVTELSSTTTTGTATTTTPEVELTPFFSGIALDVTPQIDQNNHVTLHIHPTVSEVSDQTKEITVAGQLQRFPLAFSTVRESDSIIRARSGQVVVIGGLMKNEERTREAGVPVLSSIPGVGKLFQHTQASSVKSELVILLRPIVVNTSGDWNRSVNESRERVKGLQGKLPSRW